MANRERLVLVDGSAVFHRGYHAIPHLTNAEGTPTNATFGFTTILLKVLSELNPTYAIVTWDKSSDTFRKDMYPEYKATRKKQPDDLYAQVPHTKEVTQALGLPWIELHNYEADDIIGTLAAKAERQGLETMIVTGDKDEFQLIDNYTKVYTMRRGFTDTVVYDLAALHERYGVTPKQFIDVKALMGDSSDNIPGVEGVGEKTATNLITTYGSLDGVYKNIDQLKGKLRERLETNKDTAYLSQKLSTIVCDAPVELDLPAAKLGQYDRQKIHNLFRDLGFKSLLNKLPGEAEAKPEGPPTLFDNQEDTVEKVRAHLSDVRYVSVTTPDTLEKLVQELKNVKAFAFDTETTAVNEMTADIVGISLSFNEKDGYYIPVSHQQGTQLDKQMVLDALRPAFEDKAIGKVGHNAKYDYKIMKRHGITASPIVFDTMIAAFIINPLSRSQSLNDLVYSEFGIEMIPISDLIGKGKNQVCFDDTQIEAATTYAAEDADMTWRLYNLMQPKITEQKFDRLAQETEWPLIEVLGDMELAGIQLDVPFLTAFSQRLAKDIDLLQGKIWEAAGEEFNIASPAQLSEILFNKLNLNNVGVKKGKTGFSAAASELEKLQNEHIIIPLISEYRELAKLQSTYVDALPQLVDSKSRVHTRFNQTTAQTGRLSSTDPNLQNIPVRTMIGREIRKAFIAPPGRVLVSADYSQIELRIAAALSQDPGMIETFKQGIDLHQQTATELYSIPLDQVTKDQRSSAKTINFGVLYGMSPHGLSIATGMSREEAVAFIERYFEIRQPLKAYIEETKRFARENLYTETLLGRKRPCPEINSNNFLIKQSAERVAVNVPIQGSAADIMKLAMVALAPQLPKGAQLLLQIHDELIIEADESQAPAISRLMESTMTGVYDLGVPIATETATGHSWGDL